MNDFNSQFISVEKLINSHTVIMNESEVQTGTLTYIEGELFEIRLLQNKRFVLGESIEVIIYSQEGILRFSTHIIAKDMDLLMLHVPVDLQAKLSRKREHPRVHFMVNGEIQNEGNVSVEIQNISLGGVGFVSQASFKERNMYPIEIPMGGLFSCSIEVKHIKRMDKGFFYGCKFIDLTERQIINLRAGIIRGQIEERIQSKKDDTL